ncbi:MAG: B3/B4 domain-containing protein [Candidatus Helarchaeota archaeon]
MKVNWDPAVQQQIEPFSLGLGIIKAVKVLNEPKNLEAIKEKVFNDIRENFTIENIKNTAVVSAYRQFYWKYLSIDPTKIRPSGEALVRRVLKRQKVPIINNIVYGINLASIETQLSFSGFDLDKVTPPLEIRYARTGEFFQGIGTRSRKLQGNELLLSDSEKILCIYAYGDADITKVEGTTKNILLVTYGVPKIEENILRRGIEIGLDYIQQTAGGFKEDIEINKSSHQGP